MARPMTARPFSGVFRSLATISLLGAATAMGAGMVFLTQTLLARKLGPQAYGLFASSLVTVTMLAPLAGFGLTQFRLKAYGEEGWAAHRWLEPSLRFTTFTTLLTFALLLLWAFTGAPHDGTRFTLLVLSPVILSTLAANLVSNKLRLEDRYNAMALWQMTIPGTRLMLVAALLLLPVLNTNFVAIGYGIIALAVTALAVPQMRVMLRDEMDLKGHGPRVHSPAHAVRTPTIPQLWSQAWAFGLYATLYPVFLQIGTVLVKYLSGDHQAGLYGIAISVMTAIYLIPLTIYQKFLLAKLHRWATHDRDTLWKVYRHGNFAMLASGLAVGGGLAATAHWIVPLVFGEAYRPVAGILMLLAPCVPLRFLFDAVGSVLLTENHMRYRLYAMGIGASVVIVLDLLLIPRFQAYGAAIATVAGEAALLAATYYCVRRFAKPGR